MTDDQDDWDCDGYPCPKCGDLETRSRACDEWNCDDGLIDEHEDDPINFARGEEFSMCQECFGTGIVRWCSKCGCDISSHEHQQDRHS